MGKTRERWLVDGMDEYLKRLSPHVLFECAWYKDQSALEEALKKESHCILLDPQGKMMGSVDFTDWLFSEIEKAGSRLSIAIGGPDGFSESIKQGKSLLSFSRMTFTHQLTRLVLLEQLFRAFEIRKGSGYHR